MQLKYVFQPSIKYIILDGNGSADNFEVQEKYNLAGKGSNPKTNLAKSGKNRSSIEKGLVKYKKQKKKNNFFKKLSFKIVQNLA